MPEHPPKPEAAPDEGDHTLLRPTGNTPPPQAGAVPLFAGRYALGRLLGRGGMGAVYQARDTLVGDAVALKLLELGKDASPDALERFGREVRLARRISHPHVARMHDLGTHEGQAFLTMEYVEGEDLRALLARERMLSAPQAARIALAIAEGLGAAHAAGVVHRDLKPANILIEAGGRVVLTDFGIARAVAGEMASRTQGLIGTPMYMAPEQVTGEPVDARADLYALGLLLFEMLTGQGPFPAETPWAMAMLRLRQAPPDLRQRDSIPAPLAELVHRCLGRSPEERPASAEEAAGVLRDWLADAPGSSTLRGLTPPAPVTGVRPLSSMPTGVTVGGLSGMTAGVTPGTPTPGTRNMPSVTYPVALLPLRFQGPRELDYLGDSLTETLIDQLSRARGLRVPGVGVTARFREARDPRAVGQELGVDWVVDGTMQSAGPLVRVSMRLLEARSGTQVWSGRFEHASTDAFELQDKLGPRVAEVLRGELLLAVWRPSVPPEALALYRQATAQLYRPMQDKHEVVLALLDECLALAPDFAPAMALHAVVRARSRFVGLTGSERETNEAAQHSLQRALRRAPDMAETHLARAMFASQANDWHAAVVAARVALDIAPFHAPSLLFLGGLQCEAGRADEGLVRLRLCYELSPDLVMALFEYARCSAMRGHKEDARWAMEQLASSHTYRTASGSLRVRITAWWGEHEALRRHRQEADVREGDFMARTSDLYAAVVLGEAEPSEYVDWLREPLERTTSPRFLSLLCQLLTELLCLCGRAEEAMGYLQRAADGALIDLEWLERCPALAPLRSLPGFAESRRKVRTRVEAIWHG